MAGARPGEAAVAEAAFPLTVLSAAQWIVDREAGLEGGTRAFVAGIHHAAVVAGEEDKRAVVELEPVSVASTCPTLQSSSWMKSPYFPGGLFVNCGLGTIGSCTAFGA